MTTKPSLALIPSAYKASKVYSVLPNDGTGDFDFSRATTATRINKDGLIETVGSNIPRLNYPMIDGVVSGCPSLLLEPTRSNDLQRSQEFDNAYWTKYQTSVSANSSISPDGTLNADKLIEDNSNSTHQLGRAIGYNSGTTYTVSLFAKSSNRNLEIAAGNTGTFPVKAIFDLSNGTVLSSTLGNSSIENYGNGWYRCIITATALATATTNINFGLTNGSTLSYSGDGVSFIELFGAMREQGSYATSYIPTSGATATRNAETSSKANISNLINSSEGVLYAEISALTNESDTKRITLSDGTSSNRLTILLGDNLIGIVQVSAGSVNINQTLSGYDVTSIHKICFKYKTDYFALWVNGFEIFTDTSSNAYGSDVLNRIAFDNGYSGNNFYGNVKQIQYFDKALTDAELQALTQV